MEHKILYFHLIDASYMCLKLSAMTSNPRDVIPLCTYMILKVKGIKHT